MKRRGSLFRLGLIITILATFAVLLSISDSLPPQSLVSTVSAQEKGGVVKPKPKQNSRPKTISSLADTTWKVTVPNCPWDRCECDEVFNFMSSGKFSVATLGCAVGPEYDKEGTMMRYGSWQQVGNTFSISVSGSFTDSWIEAGKKMSKTTTSDETARIEGVIQSNRLKGRMIMPEGTAKFTGIKMK